MRAAFGQAVSQCEGLFDRYMTAALQVSADLESLIQMENAFDLRLDSQRLLSELSGSEQNLPEGTSAGFYIRGRDTVYLSGGQRTYSQFENELALQPNLNMSHFFSRLNTLSEAAVFALQYDEIPQRQDDRLAVFMAPVPYLSVTPTCTAFYLFPQGEVTGSFTNTMGEFGGNVTILSRALEPIYSADGLPGAPGTDELPHLKGTAR